MANRPEGATDVEEGELVEEASAAAQKKKLPFKITRRKQFPACSSFQEFKILKKCGEGTFGEVHMARDRRTDLIVALKKIVCSEKTDGFPITSLREIKFLNQISHRNIVKLQEIAISKNCDDRVEDFYLVFPFFEHDLAGLLRNPAVTLPMAHAKYYMQEIIRGCSAMHKAGLVHRDLKASNILIDNKGSVRIADFGLTQLFTPVRTEYTPGVVTRWYRAPELLLGTRSYTSAIDIWSLGCIFLEIFVRSPILMGNSDIHQLELICDLCGSPSLSDWPEMEALPDYKAVSLPSGRCSKIFKQFSNLDRSFLLLVEKMLCWNPKKRPTAQEVLSHDFFYSHPIASSAGSLQAFPPCHEIDHPNPTAGYQNRPRTASECSHDKPTNAHRQVFFDHSSKRHRL